ncbi:response regulator transcription factor [Amphibacillus jilinensis]|uniref:response regulator transcription factor n=1 Tax=Amphibacillus jilinensis TaxID=1216008 RepID=UPI0002E9BDEE|nr:response regulator transcription factor [Amphibacillus jilinensis]
MKLLIIEDDPQLSDTIKQTTQYNYDVTQAYDGSEGLYYAEQDIYDLIILDLMLPSIDGYHVLKNLRNKNITTPVLILTAKDGIDDKVKGFKVGADDYIVKPFHREELLLRLEAILRRVHGDFQEQTLSFLDLQLHSTKKTVHINGDPMILNGKQFELLEYLIHNQGVILTKEQIFDRIWGFESETGYTVVEVYISHLRKKLKPYRYEHYLKTLRGLGYLLSDAGEVNE